MTKTCLKSGHPCTCSNIPQAGPCYTQSAKYEVGKAAPRWGGAAPPAPSKPTEQGVNATLAERGARYGSFVDHAAIAEALISTAMSYPGWRKLAPDQRQSFRMFADKQARILSGDPNYSDSWHDIAGYATLIDNRLKAEGK